VWRPGTLTKASGRMIRRALVVAMAAAVSVLVGVAPASADPPGDFADCQQDTTYTVSAGYSDHGIAVYAGPWRTIPLWLSDGRGDKCDDMNVQPYASGSFWVRTQFCPREPARPCWVTGWGWVSDVGSGITAYGIPTNWVYRSETGYGNEFILELY
jgi:hypothetical protein